MVTETGLISRLILFFLVIFGIITIISVLIFNPYYSGITYTTSLYNSQSSFWTLLTGIADLNFFNFGRFGYVVPFFLTFFHLIFLFQRTRKGFNWLGWLGFILGTGIAFSGIGLLYTYLGSNKHLLFNIYDVGGFFATLINYFFPQGIGFIIGILVTLFGAFLMFQCMIKRLLLDYYSFLHQGNSNSNNLEEYQNNTINSSILAESQRLQEERERVNVDNSYPFYYLPSENIKTKEAQLKQELNGIASLVMAYGKLPSLTKAQQQTCAYLERLYDNKYEKLMLVQKHLSTQSFFALLRRALVSGYTPKIQELELPKAQESRVQIDSLIPQGKEEQYFTLNYAIPEEEASKPITLLEDQVVSVLEENYESESISQDKLDSTSLDALFETEVASSQKEQEGEQNLAHFQVELDTSSSNLATINDSLVSEATVLEEVRASEAPIASIESPESTLVAAESTIPVEPAGRKSRKLSKADNSHAGYFQVDYKQNSLASKKQDLAKKQAELERLKALKEQQQKSKPSL
ncbi:hypothetical protein [Psittacicella gerlachiana]|uniref:Uncharacterized protein n=1 Tax=Psittacicella gerlachiana TaxID=2028574 RepID=A0A3A1YD13_9GAMM|nr:hypothetical protein [Psittacicella gerlachiana]RIY36042.1 hypothetical protein CKF59_03015 [Psittacicella gerlachiana]